MNPKTSALEQTSQDILPPHDYVRDIAGPPPAGAPMAGLVPHTSTASPAPTMKSRDSLDLGAAIASGDSVEVKRLLEKQKPQAYHLTVAAHHNNPAIITHLLKAGCAPSAEALMRLLKNRQFDLAQDLVRQGMPQDRTMLDTDDFDTIDFLLRNGMKPDEDHLARAIGLGLLKQIDAFIAHRAPLQSESITAAIDRAVTRAWVDVIELLLNKRVPLSDKTIQTIRANSNPEIRSVWDKFVSKHNLQVTSLTSMKKLSRPHSAEGENSSGFNADKTSGRTTNRSILKLDLSASALRNLAQPSLAEASLPVLRDLSSIQPDNK